MVDMPHRKNVQWFDHGTYQGGTNREFDAVHISDQENQMIVVFRKDTGLLVNSQIQNRELEISVGEKTGFVDSCRNPISKVISL